jgi:hypothetical protein
MHKILGDGLDFELPGGCIKDLRVGKCRDEQQRNKASKLFHGAHAGANAARWRMVSARLAGM